MSELQTNLWSYLWDLVDGGIDDVLDYLQGEMGITGLSVATSYPEIDQLRPRDAIKPRIFRSAGGVQFQPQSAHYHSTRMRPVVAAWLKKSNPLTAVAEACAKRHLRLRAWHVCCDSPVTASRYAGNTVKNVFGDSSRRWLCPANPDVREYLRATVEDLSEHYPFETIELDRLSFPSAKRGMAPLQTGIDLGEMGTWLTDLCFCESCRQSATREGIDVEAASQSAQATLRQLFDTGETTQLPLHEFIADQPALQTYVSWRCEQVTSLVHTIKQACRCRLVVHRKGTSLREATDFTAIAQQCDGLLTSCSPLEGEMLESQIGSTCQQTGDINRVELGLTACSPACPNYDTLVRAMSEAARQGIRRIGIANYGLLPAPRLAWIRQATRYAQREYS